MSNIHRTRTTRSHTKPKSSVGIPTHAQDSTLGLTQDEKRELYLKPYSDACECSGCDEFFNSVAAFDKHQYWVGDDVRCMTVKEMQAKGMGRNERGLWVTRLWATPEDAKSSYGRG